jgi:hypothetical protein
MDWVFLVAGAWHDQRSFSLSASGWWGGVGLSAGVMNGLPQLLPAAGRLQLGAAGGHCRAALRARSQLSGWRTGAERS